ncbi:MAG: 30S ribosomal protein S5 [bacterium]
MSDDILKNNEETSFDEEEFEDDHSESSVEITEEFGEHVEIEEVVEPLPIEEKVIHINRVAKVIKGGRKFGFTALVAVGNVNGMIGLGYGKANDVQSAIKKGVDQANKNMIEIPVVNDTLPYEIMFKYGAAKVFMKPASKGTGVIAGGPMRAILEISGVKNVLAKSIGSKNQINVARATFEALKSMRWPEEITEKRKRTVENYG